MRRRWGQWCLGAAGAALVLSFVASVTGDVAGEAEALAAVSYLLALAACPLVVVASVLLILARIGRR